MPKPIYTAEATVTGGRVHGHGRSSDGELDVQLAAARRGRRHQPRAAVRGRLRRVLRERSGDRGAARALVAAAHRVCPYSDATRGNVDVTITVNGEPLR
jgi:organic hydroperoxide reductase OsmC/OhrA